MKIVLLSILLLVSRPCHPNGDIIPCTHFHSGGDVIPCQHRVHSLGDGIVPCVHYGIHPGGDIISCQHVVHSAGDIIPCTHLHSGGDIIPCTHTCWDY